jgi:hypothetical protein
MFGKVHEVQERLFLHRHHSQSSGRAHPIKAGWHARAVWFDPALQGKVLMSRWRQFWEYHRIALTAPISIKDKLLCFVWLYISYRHKIKYLARELWVGVVGNVLRLFRRSDRPPAADSRRDARQSA